MRTLSAALLLVLALAAPALAKPETGVIIAESAGDFPGDAAAVKATNAGWGSLFVGWSALEPADNQYDQTWVDQYRRRFQAMKSAGLKVNVTFINVPQWASGNANPHYPPAGAASFGDFVAWFAQGFGAEVDGYELGNEPNGGDFWLPGPEPARYAAFAQAGVDAVETFDPQGISFVGSLAGADDEFMDDVLEAGLTGFDAVSFHSGTACKIEAPGEYIREIGTADIHDNSTTGYRDLEWTLRMRGVQNPVLADTAAGWSTSLETCDRGASKGKKPNGVSEALQGQYIADSIGCAAQDPYLRYYFVFSLFDAGTSDAVWDHRMGLLHGNGAPKAGYAKVQQAFAGPPLYGPGGFCGGYVDHTPPSVELTTTAPAPDGVALYAKTLQLTARGVDEHPVVQVKMYADGKEISGTTRDGAMSFDPWFGAGSLPLGEHRITATARDEAGNVSDPVALRVRRVDPARLPAVRTKLEYEVKVKKKRRVRINGRLIAPATLVKPGGRVRIHFKRGRFVSKYSVSAAEPFKKTYRLRKGGRWLVRVFYEGDKPFQKSRAKSRRIRVR